MLKEIRKFIVRALRRWYVPSEEDGNAYIDGRLDFARRLSRPFLHIPCRLFRQEALAEYIWLWERMTDYSPAHSGVRVSFMVGDIKELINGYPRGRLRFEEIRERVGEKLQAGHDKNLRYDWIILNGLLDHVDDTLAWFDQTRDDPEMRGFLDRVSLLVEPLLLQEERWADIAFLHPSPVNDLEKKWRMLAWKPEDGGSNPEYGSRPLDSGMERLVRDFSGMLYASLLHVGREAEAAELVRKARPVLDQKRLVHELVEMACRAKCAREEHMAWLDEYHDPDDRSVEDLRARLVDQLGLI